MSVTNDSVINKMQHKYWITKQTVIQKLGKKEDEFVVASDSQLDAKLELYRSIKQTTTALLKIVCSYQNCINALATEETEMGKFMKEYGLIDSTRAGKMLVAVGTSLSYTGQQRYFLLSPLERMYQKLDTFHRRALVDTTQNIERTEKARTEYRAALSWLKDISQELNPDTYRQMEQFKMVKEHVKRSKDNFDFLKRICLIKIDVLAASRSNMFSTLLHHYEKSLQEFTAKCLKTFDVITESFKGYQHIDFCVVKELSDLKPESSISQQIENEGVKLLELDNEKETEEEEKEEEKFLFEIDPNNKAKDNTTLVDLGVAAADSKSELNIDLLSDFLDSTSTTSTTNNNFFLPSQLLSQQMNQNPIDGSSKIKQSSTNGKPTVSKKSARESASTSKQNPWYDIFAELDPLSNPETISKTFNGEQYRNC